MKGDGRGPREFARAASIEDRLIDISTRVSVEGDSAKITFATRYGAPVTMRVDIDQMLNVYHEIWHTTATMVARQKLKVDVGQGKLAELQDTALRPLESGFRFDNKSGDIYAIHSFLNHCPVILRVSYERLLENLARIDLMIRRTRN